MLTGISAQSPFNTAPDYWPEEALSALADYESFSGNPCEARHLLDDLARRAKGSWQAQAQQKSAVLTCGPEQKQTRAWRNLFFGREVTLHCVYKGGGAAASWDRACADQASLITAHGALKLDQPAAAAAWAASEQCAQGCKRPGVQLFITAGGQLKKRDNPQNPMGKDHQFSGQISSFVVRDGTLEFADIYSGVGGWNPVSSDMAMDVLAIQSGRRFRDKASAYYAKE